MKRKTNYFLIGVFVLAGTALTVAAVVLLGAGVFATRGLMVETYFTESVQGLEKGAIVRFRGVRVGTVRQIALASQLYDTGKPYAAVRCEIETTEGATTTAALRARIEQHIDNGFRMRLASQGITGSLYIETDLVPSDTRPPLPIDWTPKYLYVPSAPSRIQQLGTSVEKILSSLSTADFPGLVQDARSTLRKIESAVEEADFGSFGREVHGVAGEARDVLAQARTELKQIGDRADALFAAISPEDLHRATASIADFAAELPATRARLDQTLAHATELLGRVEGQVRGSSREVDSILSDLRRTATSLANLAETAERYPSLLLLGAPPPPPELNK